MEFTTFAGLTLFVAVVSMTPGPNNLMLAASGANFGFRRTLPHICGVIFGFTVMVIATGFGLGAVFAAVPSLHTVMRVFSIIFLLYLSWRIAIAGSPKVASDARPLSFVAAAMFQLVNPKGLSFLASIMTAYISSDDTLLPQLLPIVILLPAMTLLSALTWSLFGTVIGRLLTNARTRRIFNISMASLLVGCIVPIALS